MAKNTGRLAGLAALAGAAYLHSQRQNKSDGMTPAQNDTLANVNTQRAMTPEQNDTLARVNKEAATGQTGINAAIREKILTPKAAANDKAPTQGVLPSETPMAQSSTAPAKSVGSTQKKNIVSKKQMDEYKQKFGQDKTLRDYMNAQRAMKNAPIKPVALPEMNNGGKVRKMASGGMTSKASSASNRADGIATRGKTKCKMY